MQAMFAMCTRSKAKSALINLCSLEPKRTVLTKNLSQQPTDSKQIASCLLRLGTGVVTAHACVHLT
jgi:hypothetical protein